MAILFIEGFDQYGTDSSNMLSGPWAEVTITPTTLPYNGSYIYTDQTNPRTGSNSLFRPGGRQALGSTINLQTTYAVCRRVIGPVQSVVGCGFGVYQSALPTVSYKETFIDFRDQNNKILITLTELADGTLVVKLGTRWGTELARSNAPVMMAESYQHVEIAVGFSATDGFVEVRVDGVSVINENGISTGSDLCSQLGFFTAIAEDGNSSQDIIGGQLSDAWIDDIFCWNDSGVVNNDFIGDRRVRTLYPDSDQATQEWTPVGVSTGFDAINDPTPDFDASYIEAGPTSPVTSEFGMTNLPQNVGAVTAIHTYVMQKKVEAGDGNTQVSLISNGSAANGLDRPITPVYTYWQDVFETDPDTGTAWTAEKVNAATFRIRRTLA